MSESNSQDANKNPAEVSLSLRFNQLLKDWMESSGFFVDAGLILVWAVLIVTGIGMCRSFELRQLLFPEFLTALCLVTNELMWRLSSAGRFDETFTDRDRSDVSKLARFFTFLIFFGIYLVLRLGWTSLEDHRRLVFVVLIWALAALTIGGLIGFLFGIPRTLSGEANKPVEAGAEGSESKASGYRVNTNLERISDWLTQIIVGGTVTQLALFPQYLKRLGAYFANEIAPKSPPSGWSLAGIGTTLFFVGLGFLGSYLITRLYLSGAIQRADGGGSKVQNLPTLTDEELNALEDSPLHYDDQATEFDSQATKAAEKILKLPLSSLTNWRDMRVWAKAQLAKSKPDEAIKGYVKVFDIVPDDAEARLGYAISLGLTNNKSATALVLTQLERARDCITRKTSPVLIKNIFKSLTYAYLFLKRPENFMKTLDAAAEYKFDYQGTDSAGISLNTACAYGHAFVWLQDDTNRIFETRWFHDHNPVESSVTMGNADAQQACREKAYEAIRLAWERGPGMHEKISLMLSDKAPAIDDDLTVFAKDEKFDRFRGKP